MLTTNLKELQIQEAKNRLKSLNLHPNVYKEFTQGKLNLSLGGILFWLDEVQQKIVDDFQERTGSIVYHVIESFTDFGEMLSLLYVSKEVEEWEIDKADLEDSIVFAYVYNVDAPEFSEYGSIGIKEVIGGLVRVQ